MTPVAAYYIFKPSRHERDAAAAHGIDARQRRRPLLDRVRGLRVAARRPAAQSHRPA